MTLTLPSAIFQQLVQFIQPFMIDPEEREAWITQAFYLREPRIFGNLDRQGAPMVFTVKCVRFLIDSECFVDPNREHPASVLLNTLRMGCGNEKHKQIDALVSVLDDVCSEPIPTPAAPAASPRPADPIVQSIATPFDKRTPTIFLSYSHANTDFAQKLIGDLQRAGHAVWIDTSSLKGGDEWISAISERIINSYGFVLVATKQALKSQWVRDEILWAKQRNKRIVTVLLEDVTSEKEFFPLVSYQGVKFYEVEYAMALPKLLEGLPAPRLESAEPPTAADTPRHISQRELELQYLERLNLENWLATIKRIEQYTTLTGTAQVTQARDASALMTQKYRHLREMFGEEKRTEATRESREYNDIIQAIREIKRAVLLGEPGAGKTTTLWRLAKDLFDTAMADPKAPIPVLVRLGKWTSADEPLIAFIRHELGELGAHLDKLIADKRVVLLLDGLNEIPLAQRKAGKDEQVKAFIETAYKANPNLIGVISCRERDYTLDLGFDRIEVAPLDPLRIREFVTRYLDPTKGDGTGETMFWRLAGESARKTTANFKNEFARKLPDWERIFWFDDTLPNGMEWGPINWQWIVWLHERKNLPDLLTLAQNSYMLMMMTDIYRDKSTLSENRGELFIQFVNKLIDRELKTNELMAGHEAALMIALARLAYAMQIQRTPLASGSDAESEGDSSTALPIAEVNPLLLDDDLLYLAGSTSILSIGETVRFSHQLLQEYFAALYMMLEIKAGRLKAADLWKPTDWWQPIGWEEAAILLVGMFPAQIDWVAAANPELAAQCVVRSGAGLTRLALEKYREMWIPRLTDLKGDPESKARAAVGRALGLADLDNRRGVGLRADRLPDLMWCEVPAGAFIYQDGKKVGGGMFGGPVKVVPNLTLSAFSISKYPITYRQFQAFLDDADGFHDAKWWNGLHKDGLGQQQNGPGGQRFEFWDHPREAVSWYDAMAYCRWLTVKLGYEITLPTEEQWEKAARGTDGRVYPYGNKFDAAKSNTRETGIGQTSAVGIFPNSASPYGVLDMSGNVWEWCFNEHSNVYTNNESNNSPRALRGGSWEYERDFARITYHRGFGPSDRGYFYGFGFRVVCSAPVS